MSNFDFDDYLSTHLADDQKRRRYVQNSAIVDAAVELNRALEFAGISQRELAERLGKSEGFVSQVLSGGSNVTLRTLGDFAWGLNCSFEFTIRHGGGVSYQRDSWQAPEIESPETETVATKATADSQLALAA